MAPPWVWKREKSQREATHPAPSKPAKLTKRREKSPAERRVPVLMRQATRRGSMDSGYVSLVGVEAKGEGNVGEKEKEAVVAQIDP